MSFLIRSFPFNITQSLSYLSLLLHFKHDLKENLNYLFVFLTRHNQPFIIFLYTFYIHFQSAHGFQQPYRSILWVIAIQFYQHLGFTFRLSFWFNSHINLLLILLCAKHNHVTYISQYYWLFYF